MKMLAKSILITGANRGIGFEFVKQLVESKPAPDFVFAACRNPNDAKDLQQFAQMHHKVKILKIEIGDEASYQHAVEDVSKAVGDQGLNVLFNNAAIYNTHSFSDVSASVMMNEYEVNCVGPLMITKAFYPLLKQAASRSEVKGLSCSRAAVLNMTSGYGCISGNTSGGIYPYRTSKVALNMVTKSMSVDFRLDHILAVSLDPGWVLTDMGGPSATTTPSQCVSGLLDVMAKLSENENGSLMSWRGYKMDF